MSALQRLAACARRLPTRRPRALVLLYHRVADVDPDPWRLSVDPVTFRAQMETLARDWHPLSLDQLVDGVEHRTLPERAVAVTFDDGYADNLAVAAPILVEYEIPATLFVATDLVDSGGPPWWDELASLLLEPAQLPDTLTLTASNGASWRVPSLSPGRRQSAAVSPSRAQPGTRLRTYYDVWVKLRALDAPARKAALEEIADWAGTQRVDERVVLTRDQLREFATLPGLTLGAHTISHPVLTNCSGDEARAEISGSAEWLRTLAGAEVTQFAYPYGEWSPSLAELVSTLAFRAAYTTQGTAISWSSLPHALARISVEQLNGGDFGRWLTKLRRAPGGVDSPGRDVL